MTKFWKRKFLPVPACKIKKYLIQMSTFCQIFITFQFLNAVQYFYLSHFINVALNLFEHAACYTKKLLIFFKETFYISNNVRIILTQINFNFVEYSHHYVLKVQIISNILFYSVIAFNLFLKLLICVPNVLLINFI